MAGLIDRVILFITILIFARVILTFVLPLMGGRPHPILITINNLVFQVTEPVLGPIRRSLPSLGGFDFSPMVVLIILFFVGKVVDAAL